MGTRVNSYFSGGVLTRKGEVIQSLIDMSRWRKQIRYAAKAKRLDLMAEAVDACFADTSKALRALIKPRPRRPKNLL